MNLHGKLKLDEYRKINDPQSQQASVTLQKQRMVDEQRTEDPYRSFRRGLIQTRQASPRNFDSNFKQSICHQRQQTSLSKASRSRTINIDGFDNLSLSGSESNLPQIGKSQSYEQGGISKISKGGRSLATLPDHNRVIGNSLELEKYLTDLNTHKHAHHKAEDKSSNLLIEINEVDSREHFGKYHQARAQTS